jgi:glucose-1-phosphate thymidylyltransferase
MNKAIILARGLGTRMRKSDPRAELTSEQAAVADVGVKAMIPIGRPFMDYLLTSLADAGYTRACLVIGPEHGQVREYYEHLNSRRIQVDFAIQSHPKGTADAVASAETFSQGDPVLVINSDNFYPKEALLALRGSFIASGLAVFTREGLVRGGNIPAERVSKFAVVQIGAEGRLIRIVEKPTKRDIASVGKPVCVSMNCWRFGPAVFEACKHIEPSPRGELEIPDAVRYAMTELDETFTVKVFDAPVLDLSSRSDIEAVKQHLKQVPVRL